MNGNNEDCSDFHRQLDDLEPGEQIIPEGRQRPLTVIARHEKPITEVHRRRHGERDYYDILELEGNGTTYHLLWHHGRDESAILRRRSQWTETQEDGKTKVEYSSQGERIYSVEIIE